MKSANRAWVARLVFAFCLVCPVVASAASCTVLATSVVFGSYTSPGGSNVDSTGTITVTCTPDYVLLACKSDYTVSLGQGNEGSFSPRKLSSGTDKLQYNLFTDSGRGVIWGDGAGGNTATVPGQISSSLLNLVCLSGFKNHTVYGRIPANQNVRAGTYSDSILVTVTF